MKNYLTAGPDGSKKSRHVGTIDAYRAVIIAEKHHHVDWSIDNFALYLQVDVTQHYGFFQVIGGIGHEICQGRVALIIFAQFDLDGCHFAVEAYHEINFPRFLLL